MAKPGYNNFDNNKDWSKYDTVKSRKKKLREDFPNAVIYPITLSDLNFAGSYVLVGALIWKDKAVMMERMGGANVVTTIMELAQKATPQNAGMIMTSIGALTGADSTGYSLSIAGGAKADKSAWVENCEESAIGRALDNLGYQSGFCSRDELEKVEHVQQATEERSALEREINGLLMQMNQKGFNMGNITQMAYQTIKPFNSFSELSPIELQRLRDLLKNQWESSSVVMVN